MFSNFFHVLVGGHPNIDILPPPLPKWVTVPSAAPAKRTVWAFREVRAVAPPRFLSP